ncbi:hypothetical protein [Piscinibacter terrae]|nr:hypothetical protein [Albitalea terrae]
MILSRPTHFISSSGMCTPLPPASRSDRLRQEFPASVDSIRRDRADQIPDGFVEDYLALHWLEWHSGSLRLTSTGTDTCEEIRDS